MGLIRGNKEFAEWWEHWMARIHSTPHHTGQKSPQADEDASPSATEPRKNANDEPQSAVPSSFTGILDLFIMESLR